MKKIKAIWNHPATPIIIFSILGIVSVTSMFYDKFKEERIKEIKKEDIYIGKIQKIEFKPGGFMSSDRTVIYCDSMVCIVNYAQSVHIGVDCWIQDKKYLYIQGASHRLKIE